MIDNKKGKRISKRKATVISGILLILVFLFAYNDSISYFGIIEIRELKQNDSEYTVVVEGDFGVRKSNFNEKDIFDIVENDESRVGNITEVWDNLTEDKSFHVLLKAYDHRNKFELERIYID